MPLTPEQIAIIRKKEAAKPDALKRDNLTNYREGYFFITLNTRNESPILSTIEGEVGMPAGRPNAPHCKYRFSGNLVGISINLCKSIQKELFINDTP